MSKTNRKNTMYLGDFFEFSLFCLGHQKALVVNTTIRASGFTLD